MPPAPAPTPPPPSPTPPPGNSAPIVDAGSDKATVEEQDVTIDGSGTRDPDSDPLSYRWTLTSAPAGSTVAVTANTPSFVFRPDVPGGYQLQLTASDASTSASDTLRVTADALFSVTAPAAFSIDGASAVGSDQLNLQLRTSAHFRGSPVTFTATSNAPWLTAPANGTFAGAGAESAVTLRLNLDELRGMENGKREARVTISPSGGWTGATVTVALDLALPRVRNVFPYVAYVGESSRVTLYGENLLKADGQSIFVGGTEALGIEAISDTRATVDLPPLAAGTYTVRIGHALDVAREMARVVVRTPPVYRDFDGGNVHVWLNTLQYDAERDALYYIMLSPGGDYFTVRLRNDGTGGWNTDLITTPLSFEAQAVALSADGKELLVASPNCWLHHIDPDTFAILASVQKAGCAEHLVFGAIAPLADGRVLVHEPAFSGDDAILEYPGFAASGVLPSRSGRFLLQNGQRDRLLYVSSFAAAPNTDVYDLGEASSTVHFQPHPAGLHHGTLSMSANGSRTLHGTNVYDRQFNLIGHVAGNLPNVRSVLNPQGTRAVVLDFDTDAITVHDISTPGPAYAQIGAAAVLPHDVGSSGRMLVPLSGGAVFVIAHIPDIIRGDTRFYVRVHPELPR